jgi:hypothetical protein
VVDAAVRGPVMHEYLGVRNGSGLADLASGAIVPDVLRQTGSAGLTVLPAGHTSAARAASLVAGTMPVVLDALADQLVLIDTQAPSDAPETTAVARLSRGVLLVADADHLDVAPGVASSLERGGHDARHRDHPRDATARAGERRMSEPCRLDSLWGASYGWNGGWARSVSSSPPANGRNGPAR